ncbi:TPA: imidazole glycerol phosphate synthase subunit HisF [archaeon]|nr:imidazole glycerol phosphate synthase subunit HisF [Candidatus Undinarchaeales archaeon SRR5007147.bin71]
MSKKARVIARLDVKGPNVIKGVQLECLRVVGKPGEMAEKYYLQGSDELIYVDIVASLYGRDNLLDIVDKASDKIFIPFTVGGGVRTLDDIREFLKAGADKVAINTAITKDPELISKGARMFGSQCIVASIEARNIGDGKWEALTDNGRETTGLDVIEWAKKVEELGAGEILLTSVDKEGTQKGLDTDLVRSVTDEVSIPVIACGGAGSSEDLLDCVRKGNTDSVAVSSILHFNKVTIPDIKSTLNSGGIEVRNLD